MTLIEIFDCWLNPILIHCNYWYIDQSTFWIIFQNSLRDSGIRGILPHILRFPQSWTRCQPLHDYDGGTRRRCVPCCKLGDSLTTKNLLYLTQKKKLWIQSLYNKCWRATVLITSIWRINFINCTEFQSFWCDFYFLQLFSSFYYYFDMKSYLLFDLETKSPQGFQIRDYHSIIFT